jgi:diphthamide synthase (EF-2-diphthine--ammonia ligase)
MSDFIQSGFKAITCCIDNSILNERFLGKELNNEFLKKLPEGVDPAGENGEFHTFCFDGPVFNQPVQFETGRTHSESLEIKSTVQTAKNTFAYIDIL